MKPKTLITALLVGIALSVLSLFVNKEVRSWEDPEYAEWPVYASLVKWPDISMMVWSNDSETTRGLGLARFDVCQAMPRSTAFGAPLPYAEHTSYCSGNETYVIRPTKAVLNVLVYTLIYLGIIALVRKLRPAKTS